MIQTTIATIITAVFLCIILSYYFLLLKPRNFPKKPEKFRSITIIIPAHNEAKYIASCVEAVLKAKFKGRKHVIVVDDGSRDNTATIAKKYPVEVHSRQHSGKSESINFALSRAKGELIAIVDGDSYIRPDALEEAIKLFTPEVAAVTAVIKVKNRTNPLGFWMHIEQLYNSLTRSLFAKVNVNIVTAGPLSVYRKRCLLEVGGFGTKGYSEDADIAIRLLKAGYRVDYAEKSVTETNMPISIKGFFRQRTRFAKGTVNILKRHVTLDNTMLRIYTLPLTFFSYWQAVIMAVITLVNIFSGYYIYFLSKGVWLDWYVARFFIEWLSVVGLLHWAYNIFTGAIPFTIVEAVGLSASLLSYPLYIIAILRYDKQFSWKHLLAVSFLFPFWIMVMFTYLLYTGEWFNKHQRNIWTK
jgi:cellulose synthase/poly-beta-1,6-N-acetylglucosamine synthase-like glycosyltransferase